MKIKTGRDCLGKTDSVRFVVGERTAFEVSIGKDGASIEVRAVNHYKVRNKVYGTSLLISPVVSNVVRIATEQA